MPVRVLARDPVKAKALANAGAEVAVGDLASRRASTRHGGRHGGRPGQPGSPRTGAERRRERRPGRRQARCQGQQQGVGRPPIAGRRGQAEIEAGLAASGLAHTLLRSNAYMQNVLALAPAIARTSGFGSSAGKGRAVMVDARDVGAASAEIAPSPPPAPGRPTGSPARSWSPTTASRRSCRSCLARVTDDVPAILGRPTRSFGQFAADYATAFS
jgi:uncharacterized protein YbjT (DUF2867 family)